MQPQVPPQFYGVPAAGGGTFGPASGGLPVPDAFADSPAASASLGADSYEPIFEDTPPTQQQKPQRRGNSAGEDDDDYMGLYNKPKKPILPPMEQAGGNDVSSLFATSASSLRQRRGGSAHEEDSAVSSSSPSRSQPAPKPTATPPARARRQPATAAKPGNWHWPWASRLAGLLLLTYFASLSYRHWEKDGFEGLADMLFNLQIFILLAAVGMLLLSPTLIGTSLVVLSYYHFSWWADLAHWLITGAFFFGTAVPVAHMSWDNYFAIADLSYHALFLPLCFLALYKNGGVRWRAGFLSIFLHSLLFLLSTTHQLPGVPSLHAYTPFAHRSANLYEQAYKSENSPPYRAFMEQAPQQLQNAADSLVPLLEQQGIHVNLERAAPEEGGALVVPFYVYSILWIVLCNFVSFVLLKLLSFILLQRGAQGKKKKAE